MGASINTVESFFDEPISRDLGRRIIRMPLDHLEDLAYRIDQHRTSILTIRRDLGPSVGACDRLVSRSDHFDAPLNDSDHLRLMLLYAPECLVADPIAYWASVNPDGHLSEEDATSLGLIIRGLADLRPVLKAGVVRLVPDARAITFYDPTFDGPNSDEPDDIPLTNFSVDVTNPDSVTRNPVMAYLLVTRIIPLEDWELEQYGVNMADPMSGDLQFAAEYALSKLSDGHRYGSPILPESITERLLNLCGSDLTRRHEVEMGMTLSEYVESFSSARNSVFPVSSGPETAHQLELATELRLDGMISSRAKVRRNSGIDAAMKFSVPSMSTVDMRDVVMLRESEETFEEFRHALASVMEAIEDNVDLASLSYSSFCREVVAASSDILMPAVNVLERRSGHLRALSAIAGFGAGHLTRMALSGFAAKRPIHGAIELAAWKLASGRVERLATSNTRSRLDQPQAAREIAARVLVSMLDFGA